MVAPVAAAAPAINAWIPAIAGTVSSLIGGAFSDRGQSAANEANLQIARENRQWQERMSSTAYQRAAQDLKRAGLNRILALGNSASTPSGNIAVMQNEKINRGQAMAQSVGTALSLRMQQAQIQNVQAQTANLVKDAELKGAQISKTGVETTRLTAETANIRKMYFQIEENIRKIIAETKLTTAKGGREAAISAMYDMIPEVITAMADTFNWSDAFTDKLLMYFYRRQDSLK